MSLKKYDFIPSQWSKEKPESGKFLAEEASELEKAEERYDLAVLGATRRHVKNFLESVKTREKPVADILEGHISSSTCVLANNAMELGRSLTLDKKSGRPLEDEDATKLLARDYRQPWIHPTAESV